MHSAIDEPASCSLAYFVLACTEWSPPITAAIYRAGGDGQSFDSCEAGTVTIDIPSGAGSCTGSASVNWPEPLEYSDDLSF